MNQETQPSIPEKSVCFETLSIKDTERALGTSTTQGLSSEEAARRLEKFGKNKLAEKKKKTAFGLFLEQLNNPMIFVLLAAIAVTIAVSIFETVSAARAGWITAEGTQITNAFMQVGDWPDVIIIFAVILINGIIGTVQELKAQTSLEALKNLSSPESTVIRDGQKMRVKSTDLVLGDIVLLEEGDTIGADLRLVESHNLKTNESSLTGESLPIEKDASYVFTENMPIGDRTNMVYMSTPVSYGRGMGIVTATGMNTEIGKIANALENEDDDQTPLQKVLEKLSKSLGLLTTAVVALVLLVDIAWIFADGTSGAVEAWTEAVLSAIALAVAAIPEGLSAVVTIVLSIGMGRMVKVNTVVRKLPSVETLGAVSVVCSDKTGTLTQNRMTVVEAYTLGRYYQTEELAASASDSLRKLAVGMALCSNATIENGVIGDPTEIALVRFAQDLGHTKSGLEGERPRLEEYPFDSVRKMMTTRHKTANGSISYTKGALDSILKYTTKILDGDTVREILPEDIDTIYAANRAYSDKALRVLALAYNEKDHIEEADLVFVGLVAMIDPPRPEAKSAVATFKEAGIATVMITGDHKDTAFAIARELGIASDISECLTGADVDGLDENALREACKTVRVFARVSPENKVQIVKAFKANGLICAMTGDGVNDAPSLRAADIGIAMGITGTDVAKGAADMILTDDNFASIEKAVEEGRNIYANIKKTVIFLLSSNIAEVLAMLFIICIGFPAPLLAIHLLWVNLITDSLPAIALGMDPKAGDIMREKPRDPKEGIFAGGGLFNTILYGAIITVAVLSSYFICGFLHGAESIFAVKDLLSSNPLFLHHAQTMAFTTLAACELFHMLGMSNLNHSFVQVFKGKNLMMLIAFLSGFVLQLAVIEIPFVRSLFSTYNLSAANWLVCIGLALIPLLAHEIIVLVKSIKKAMQKNA